MGAGAAARSAGRPLSFRGAEQTKHHPTTETERVCYGARYRSRCQACCFANFFRLWASALPFCMCRCAYMQPQLYRFRHRLAEFHPQVVRRLFSKPVEKYGFRPLPWPLPRQRGRAGPVCRRPMLFPQRPFAGFCAGHVPVRRGGRPAELLLESPILDAAHPGAQGHSMSMCCTRFRLGADLRGAGHHGPAGGVGAARWQWIDALWASRVASAVLFCRCRWPAKNGDAPPLPLRALARKGVFYTLLAAIVLGGAAGSHGQSAFWKKRPAACRSWPRATCGADMLSR